MGEQQQGQGGQDTGQQGGGPPEPKAFTPITSQEDLNRIIAERVQRERGKYADYADLKAKASRLDEIEEASKSETQKLAEAMAAAERERDQARAEALRLRVATKFGVSDEDADLFLTGTDEATLTKQAERLAQHAEGRKKQGNHVPREGTTTPNAADGNEREFARSLFGGD